MACFAGMDKHRWRARRGQRGSDLATNVPTFTHAHHHDVARSFKQHMDRFNKGRA